MNTIVEVLQDKIAKDTLVLPTLPSIALRIRKKADDPAVELRDMADIIAQDPAISARLIKLANSSLMSRGDKVTDLYQAVARIGLKKIKSVATVIAFEQLFVSKNTDLVTYLKNTWQDSVTVAAHAVSLFKLYSSKTKSDLSLDTLMLISIVHRIGVLPIILQCEEYPELFDKEMLALAINSHSNKLSGDILRNWNFPDECIEAVLKWKIIEGSKEVTYKDFMQLAYQASGKMKKHNSLIIKLGVNKGIIEDDKYFQSPEYLQTLNKVLAVFA